MIIFDNESTKVADYTTDIEAEDIIPLLTMIEKNVVTDQMAWNEAFESAQRHPGSDWLLE